MHNNKENGPDISQFKGFIDQEDMDKLINEYFMIDVMNDNCSSEGLL